MTVRQCFRSFVKKSPVASGDDAIGEAFRTADLVLKQQPTNPSTEGQ